MGLFSWNRSHFKQDEPSRLELAREKARQVAARWIMVCRFVDRRDGKQCRCCDARSDPEATGLLKKGHRHHMVYRSAGGSDTTDNLVTLCAICHSDEHHNKLRIEGNPDDKLTFWRKDDQGIWYVTRREIAVRVIEKD